jgi:hypothetical protein
VFKAGTDLVSEYPTGKIPVAQKQHIFG